MATRAIPIEEKSEVVKAMQKESQDFASTASSMRSEVSNMGKKTKRPRR